MPRPKKIRRIGFIPNITEFIPKGNIDSNNNIVILNVEELEVIRLIDIEKLDQEQSSKKMEISRGTVQRILNSARNKVADSLINGKRIIIESGNYCIDECRYICNKCKTIYKINNNKIICPKCNSEEYICQKQKNFCLNKCKRFRGGNA